MTIWAEEDVSNSVQWMGILCWYFITYRNIEWCLFIHHYTKTSCIVSMRNDSGYYYRVTHFWHRYFWKATNMALRHKPNHQSHVQLRRLFWFCIHRFAMCINLHEIHRLTHVFSQCKIPCRFFTVVKLKLLFCIEAETSYCIEFE